MVLSLTPKWVYHVLECRKCHHLIVGWGFMTLLKLCLFCTSFYLFQLYMILKRSDQDILLFKNLFLSSFLLVSFLSHSEFSYFLETLEKNFQGNKIVTKKSKIPNFLIHSVVNMMKVSVCLHIKQQSRQNDLFTNGSR